MLTDLSEDYDIVREYRCPDCGWRPNVTTDTYVLAASRRVHAEIDLALHQAECHPEEAP